MELYKPLTVIFLIIAIPVFFLILPYWNVNKKEIEEVEETKEPKKEGLTLFDIIFFLWLFK